MSPQGLAKATGAACVRRSQRPPHASAPA